MQKIDFDRHFQWGKKIATGSRGPVYRAVCTQAYTTKLGKQLRAGDEVAVKVFLLERMTTTQRAQLQSEFQVLQSVGHIDTCEELLDGFQTTDDLILVKTLCHLAPLAQAILSAGATSSITETIMADYMKDPFATVFALHERSIVHAGISVSDA